MWLRKIFIENEMELFAYICNLQLVISSLM